MKTKIPTNKRRDRNETTKNNGETKPYKHTKKKKTLFSQRKKERKKRRN